MQQVAAKDLSKGDAIAVGPLLLGLKGLVTDCPPVVVTERLLTRGGDYRIRTTGGAFTVPGHVLFDRVNIEAEKAGRPVK